jgi:hypothetical protein
LVCRQKRLDLRPLLIVEPKQMRFHRLASKSVDQPLESKHGLLILGHVPKKLLDFFDPDVLQLFDFERVLFDQRIPFDRDAL